jgi:hypothetical protein
MIKAVLLKVLTICRMWCNIFDLKPALIPVNHVYAPRLFKDSLLFSDFNIAYFIGKAIIIYINNNEEICYQPVIRLWVGLSSVEFDRRPSWRL